MTVPCPHCGGSLVLSAPGTQAPTSRSARTAQRAAMDSLRGQLLEYLDTVRTTDVQLAAAHVFDAGHPSRAQLEQVRRQLDGLVRDQWCTRSTASVSGWNGGRATTYTLMRTS